MQIYVGNLPNGYRLSDLVQMFETYGCVSRASAVRDFAFVAIFDNEAARAAVNGLNGNIFGDQEIVVEQARFYPRNRFHNGGFGRATGVPHPQGQHNDDNDNAGFGETVNGSRSFYVDDNGFQGNGQVNHMEGQVTEHAHQPFPQQEYNVRGRGQARGGRRGFRGRGNRANGGGRGHRVAAEQQYQKQEEAGNHQVNGEVIPATQVNDSNAGAAVTTNYQSDEATQNNTEGQEKRNAASDSGQSHGANGGGRGRGGPRRSGRRGRGRGGFGGGSSRGADGKGVDIKQQQQQTQMSPPGTVQQGGAGDSHPRVNGAQDFPAGDGMVMTDKSNQLAGGAGDMRVARGDHVAV